MAIFSRICGLFSRRHGISVAARPVTLVNERTECLPGHFVYPGIDFIDQIQVDGQRVGHIDYSINPLGDRLYINMIEVSPDRQRERIGTAVLWHLWRTYRMAIVPIEQYATSHGFWSQARARLGAAGACIEQDLRGVDQLQLEQQRWQHLVPESAHERRIRKMQASPGADLERSA
ncbi:GNAT family N-acetyltransferase [Pseudomonas viridiflava]|uniref:GNAT family N-acetyltransferase n=1 Tax=Pseudomonas viridiflava TaxID=33069 RepID=UPI002EAC455A|nr:GNAT family N-acetyltransferase [Pseudomonas viridiflava]